MATYYRWRKSTANYQVEQSDYGESGVTLGVTGSHIYVYNAEQQNGQFVIAGALLGDLTVSGAQVYSIEFGETYTFLTSPADPGTIVQEDVYSFYRTHPATGYVQLGNDRKLYAYNTGVYKLTIVASPGTSQGYVYSTSSSAYPTNGVQNSYYYNNRTTITSPTNPSQLSYPSLINQQLITLSWNASTSEVPDYPIQSYELSYSTDSGSQWQVIGTTSQTTYEFGIPNPYVDKIRFRVRAMDSNSQFSDYLEGTDSTIDLGEVELPVLTLPQNVKLGANITISWNSIESATNYILQRKTIDNEEWTQVYSGPNLSCFNLIDALGISYRIAFNVGSNYTSPWSQEYRLSSYEKIIEMSYLDSDGNYMPLYPRTISNAVVNSSDLIQTTMLTGKYTGNGMESNEVLLANNIEPKVGFLYDSNGNVTGSVGFNDEGNLVVDKNLGFNENGSEYGYVVIGEKNNNDFG